MKIKYKKLSKSKGRNFCDQLWALLVKLRDGNKCVICGATEYINAHHLISRRIFLTRFIVDNGISLCPKCHEYDLSLSAHTAPWNFDEWVKLNKIEQYKIWLENRKIKATGEEINYEEIYKQLEEKHKELTGNYLRLERIDEYLLFINIEKIKEQIRNNIPQQTIYESLNLPISIKKFKDFITKNKKFFET